MERYFIRIFRWLFDLSNNFLGLGDYPLSKENYNIDHIQIRVYRPDHTSLLPIIIYLHGGGWIIGSIKAYDKICQYISYNTNCIVAAINYSLAPEHIFPAAIHDVTKAYTWITTHALDLKGNPKQIIIMGDSAGGNLAASLTQSLQNMSNLPRPVLQVLFYPVLNLQSSPVNNKLSLLYKLKQYCVERYTPDTKQRINPLASPLMSHNISGLPDTLIIAAGLDILSEEALQYKKLLENGNVTVTYQTYQTLPHGFLQLLGWSKTARVALNEAFSYILQMLDLKK